LVFVNATGEHMTNSGIKRLVLAAAIAGAFGAAGGANAALIDPDGAGGVGAVAVDTVGWGNGNIRVSPITGASVTTPAVGQIVQGFGHAGLANFQDADGNNITPGGFNVNTWTYVFGARELVTSVAGTPPGGTANFITIAGGTNFFRIYYDATPGQSALTGTGFAPDGTAAGVGRTLIYEGTVRPFAGVGTPGSSNFTGQACGPAGGPACDDLDKAGGNNYNGTGGSTNIDSITGTGGGQVAVDTTFADTNFFIGGAPAAIVLSFNYFTNLPFTEVNPSGCVWNGTALVGAAGPNSTATDPPPACTNTIGTINGISGPNELLMTRASSAMAAAAVPEPGMLGLLGLGLLGLVGFRRRNS